LKDPCVANGGEGFKGKGFLRGEGLAVVKSREKMDGSLLRGLALRYRWKAKIGKPEDKEGSRVAILGLWAEF